MTLRQGGYVCSIAPLGVPMELHRAARAGAAASATGIPSRIPSGRIPSSIGCVIGRHGYASLHAVVIDRPGELDLVVVPVLRLRGGESYVVPAHGSTDGKCPRPVGIRDRPLQIISVLTQGELQSDGLISIGRDGPVSRKIAVVIIRRRSPRRSLRR